LGLFIEICRRLLVNVVLEDTFFDASIWERHAAQSMLNTILPFSFVAAAVCPIHLPVAMSLVILVAAAVLVA